MIKFEEYISNSREECSGEATEPGTDEITRMRGFDTSLKGGRFNQVWQHLGAGGRRVRSSKLLWAVMQVQGQSGLLESLSQKAKGEKMKDGL